MCTEHMFALAVIRAESLEVAQAILEAEPAVAGGVFRGEVYRFQPMLIGARPGQAPDRLR